MVKQKSTTKTTTMTTLTKQEKLAVKAAKKEKNRKTKAEREAEVESIKTQYAEWGIDESFEAVSKLYQEMQRYIDTGETVSDVLRFVECPPQPLGRNIHYFFSAKKGARCYADLRIPGNNELNLKGKSIDSVPRSYLPQRTPSTTSSIHTPSTISRNDFESSEAPNLVDVDVGAQESKIEKSAPAQTKEQKETNVVDEIAQILHGMQVQAQKEGRTLTNEEIRQVAEKYLPTPDDIKEALDKEYLPMATQLSSSVENNTDNSGKELSWDNFLQPNITVNVNHIVEQPSELNIEIIE